MNKQEFMDALKKELVHIPEADRDDIIFDYEEHFRIGISEGKTEAQIADSLGDPRTLGRQFTADFHVKAAETNTSASNTIRAVLATLGLGFFNLVIVLGPFLAVLGTLFGFFVAAIAIIISGFAVFAATVFSPVLPLTVHSSFLAFVNPASAIFASIGLVSMGLLFLIGVSYLAKFFFIVTVRYLKFNLKIIRGA